MTQVLAHVLSEQGTRTAYLSSKFLLFHFSALEMMGPAYRTFSGMMICLFFAVALMILAGLAYIFNSWFDLALVTSVPFVALFSYWFFIPESPRWLLSYGRIDEAEEVIQNMAKWNRKEISPNFVHEFVEVQLTIIHCRQCARN